MTLDNIVETTKIFGNFGNKKIVKEAEKSPKWGQIALSGHTADDAT